MGGIAEEDNEESPAESDAFLSSPRRHNVFTLDSRLSRFADDSGYEDNQPLHLQSENTNTTQRDSKPSSPPPSPKWA